MQLEAAVAGGRRCEGPRKERRREGQGDRGVSNRARLEEAAIAHRMEVRKSQEEDQKKANEAMVKANNAAQKQVVEDGKKMEHLATRRRRGPHQRPAAGHDRMPRTARTRASTSGSC